MADPVKQKPTYVEPGLFDQITDYVKALLGGPTEVMSPQALLRYKEATGVDISNRAMQAAPAASASAPTTPQSSARAPLTPQRIQQRDMPLNKQAELSRQLVLERLKGAVQNIQEAGKKSRKYTDN
jgi:hypothetical protein